jgi:hypothetical protein
MSSGELPKGRFGTLIVIIDKARNLPNRKKVGKQDAYTIVRLGHDVQRTPTDKRAGQVPSWNYEMRFKVPNEQENMLKISVFNEDSKSPDLIGDCTIDLSAIWRSHEYDSWFDLKYKGKPAGEIYAELTFYYEGPPRPKPKVALAPTNVVGEPIGHLPHGGYSPGSDPAAAFAGLSLHTPSSGQLPQGAAQAHTYIASPYDTGAHYAETWDGKRDGRLYVQPVGDLRRKSQSDARPIDAALQASVAADLYGYVPERRSSSTVPDRQVSPGGGQPHFRIASPLPDVREGYGHARISPEPPRTSSRMSGRSEGTWGPRPLPSAPGTHSPVHGQMRHQHTQSYQQPPDTYNAHPGEHHMQGANTQHAKAASMSHVPNHRTTLPPPTMAPGDLRQQPRRQDSNEAERYYREQHPYTFAPTPTQYEQRTRQLPPIPGQHADNNPPPRPQKVPLALTQAEYDLLYS